MINARNYQQAVAPGADVHPVAAMFDSSLRQQRMAHLQECGSEFYNLHRISIDRTDPGHIYFLFAPDLMRIKVGFTRDVERRFNSLLNASPCELELIGSARGAPRVEDALLCFLRPDQVKGEWFNATPRVVDAVEVARRVGNASVARKAAIHHSHLVGVAGP